MSVLARALCLPHIKLKGGKYICEGFITTKDGVGDTPIKAWNDYIQKLREFCWVWNNGQMSAMFQLQVGNNGTLYNIFNQDCYQDCFRYRHEKVNVMYFEER